MVLAQHHGLPTRLLDWTQNILVAFYFAVINNLDSDGSVFALHSIGKATSSDLTESPFSIVTPVKYYPNIITPRIRAQEGLFVACAALETPLDKALRSGWRVEILNVPARKKAELRSLLSSLVLVPDT